MAVAGTKFSTGTCTGVNVPMAGEGSILDLAKILAMSGRFWLWSGGAVLVHMSLLYSVLEWQRSGRFIL